MTDHEDDNCTEEELNDAFSHQYSVISEEFLPSKSTYVLYLCGNSDASVAAGLSDHGIEIYDIEGRPSMSFFGHDKSITGLRFSPKSQHLLYSSSLDGSIRLWDMREKNKYVAEFKGHWGTEEGNYIDHPLTTFDVCNRDRVLVGGTESFGEDSFLLFWDVRSPGNSPIGGYWESHSDEITQVKFHNVKSDLMAVGSMDGLINIFDIRQACEDDALRFSLNTDATVDKITWLDNLKTNVENSESDDALFLSCITHKETLQIWKTDDGSPTNMFSQEDIAEALKVKSPEDCYIVDVCLDEYDEEENLVLCGSTERDYSCKNDRLKSTCGVAAKFIKDKGKKDYIKAKFTKISVDSPLLSSGCFLIWCNLNEGMHFNKCLRLLCLKDGLLRPWACLHGTNQIVRCCWSNPKTGVLATGGQSGLISFWRPANKLDSSERISKMASNKIKVKKRHQINKNPY